MRRERKGENNGNGNGNGKEGSERIKRKGKGKLTLPLSTMSMTASCSSERFLGCSPTACTPESPVAVLGSVFLPRVAATKARSGDVSGLTGRNFSPLNLSSSSWRGGGMLAKWGDDTRGSDDSEEEAVCAGDRFWALGDPENEGGSFRVLSPVNLNFDTSSENDATLAGRSFKLTGASAERAGTSAELTGLMPEGIESGLRKDSPSDSKSSSSSSSLSPSPA